MGGWLCGFRKSHLDKKKSADFFRTKSFIRNLSYPNGVQEGSNGRSTGSKCLRKGSEGGVKGVQGGPRVLRNSNHIIKVPYDSSRSSGFENSVP